MTQQEYEQKKHECWEHIKFALPVPNTYRKIFDIIFDRAYALGREQETITQEEIEKAAKKYAAEVDKNVCDLYRIEEQPVSLTFGECAAESFREGAKFTLGKQEKDAENTPISERLYEEEKSRLEGIYYYLKRAADKQEDDCVSVAILFEVMERLEDIFGIDLLTNGHGKLAPKDADTVIQGWVCRDEDGRLCLYQNEPKREAYDFQPRGYWTDKTVQYIDLPPNLFPDLTWEDEPQEVEITIKRKKK